MHFLVLHIIIIIIIELLAVADALRHEQDKKVS